MLPLFSVGVSVQEKRQEAEMKVAEIQMLNFS